MPLADIHSIDGYSRGTKNEMIEKITDAMVDIEPKAKEGK